MKEHLSPETERKLISLGNRKYFRALFLTVGWIMLMIVLWIITALKWNRSFTSPSNFVYPVLCVLPFFPFKVYKILMTKTFYGNVASAKFSNAYKTTTGPITWNQAKELDILTADVVFMGENGAKFAVTYKEESVLAHELYYKQGDRVLVIRGLKYPVKVPIPETEEHICPVCGNFIKVGKKRCQWCKSDFSDEKT